MGGFQTFGPTPNAADTKIPEDNPYPDEQDPPEDPDDADEEDTTSDDEDNDSGDVTNPGFAASPSVDTSDTGTNSPDWPEEDEVTTDAPSDQESIIKEQSDDRNSFSNNPLPDLDQRVKRLTESTGDPAPVQSSPRNLLDPSSDQGNRATHLLDDQLSPLQAPSRSLLEPLSLQTPGVPAESRRATGGLPDLLSPDPALPPDPTFKIPHIPDKVWEEGDRLRAEKAEAAQAKEAPEADWWQARNMADILSRTSDYGGAEQHYRRQAESDPAGTRTEIDAVAQAMGKTDPQSAQRFLGQMDAAGLRGTDSQSRGRSYSESDLLGSWRSNVESQTGRTLTPMADTRTSTSSEDQSSPPANKADFFKSRNPSGTWDDFRGEVQSLPDTGQAGKFALVEVFGQEGGIPKDSTSTASAGILQKTLDNAKNAGVPGLEKATTPSGLTNEQRAAVMRYKLDREELSHVGGIKALDKIGDNQAAAALADTLYRHGGVEGPKLLQRAINDVEPGAVPETRFMGKQTLEAYSRLASSPETKGRLLDALAEQRKIAFPKEAERFTYYRYLGRR